MLKKPVIHNTKTLTQSRLFTIEQVDLEFSNGTRCQFERIQAGGNGAVMIVPLVDSTTVLMVREYCVGTDAYELTFPKGRIDDNEAALAAANRELMEEVGYGANRLTHIRDMSIAPAYMNFITQIVLAEDLYKKSLQGDEPEDLEVVEINLQQLSRVLQRDDLNEARSIATLFLIRDYLQAR